MEATHCVRLVRIASVKAKEKVWEKALDAAVAEIPANPANSRG